MKRLRIISFLLITAISLVNFSCGTSSKNESSNVKYFRHLQFSETSYDQMKGTHPLTAKEAETINHYRFTCNDKGQLIEVAYMRGNTLLSYSSMGAAKLEITYTDSTETQHFINKDEQVADQESVYANVYKLDKNGNRIGLSFLDKSGNKMVDRNNISYFVYKILPDGMVQEKRYDAKNEETIRSKFCPFYELRFSYDDKGHCVRLANYQADTLYSCTAENCGDIGVSYFLMKSNEAGDLDSFAVFNASGVPSNLYWGWSRFINKHDENGNLVRSDFFDQDGEPLGGKSNPITTYTYDEHGAVTEVKYFDKDMKPFASPRAGGAAMLKYTYNASGQPLDTLRFNVALEPIKKN